MQANFDKVFQALQAGNVQFIVVGGWAATFHGSSRVTLDVDVVYKRDSENIRKLAVCLEPYNPYLRGAPRGLPFRFDPATIRNGLNFTLTMAELGDVDFFGEVVGGGNYEQLLPFLEMIPAGDYEVPCVSLERLIQLKRAAGRPKDLEAVAELQAILDERGR